MKRTTMSLLLLVAVTASGCDRVKAVVDRIRGRRDTTTQQQQTPATAAADSQKVPAQPQTQAQQQRPPVRPPGYQIQTADLPYNPVDTGTIQPGMSERDVYTIWGQPVAHRQIGEMTYLFYRNGCEYSCGTHDVVILQNNQVMDAVTRHPGHRYAGVSSSPPGRVPVPNRGGDTLKVPSQSP
jgi:hypothetical protein